MGDILDCEITLARSLGWSLHEIELTDTGSILAFIGRLNQGGAQPAGTRKAPEKYCDQVEWL